VGYETSIDLYDVRVRPDKLAEVTEALAAHARGHGRHHWMVGSLKLGAGAVLSWDEVAVGKWKSHEEFIADLAGWCSRGWVSFWSREGDGAAWAYEFDGAGGFRECSARRVAAIKAAATRKRRAAGAKAARTKARQAAARKAAATRKQRHAEPGTAADGGRDAGSS
jgi:hypothetical protein